MFVYFLVNRKKKNLQEKNGVRIKSARCFFKSKDHIISKDGKQMRYGVVCVE